jgi:hypothetical protein
MTLEDEEPSRNPFPISHRQKEKALISIRYCTGRRFDLDLPPVV